MTSSFRPDFEFAPREFVPISAARSGDASDGYGFVSGAVAADAGAGLHVARTSS